MKTVLKVLTALAAVAGTVYVIATYGDKIVAWAKKLMAACPCCGDECKCEGEGECECGGECKCECAEEAAVEETPAEEAVVEEAPVEEAPVEEVIIEENEPVAEAEDFAE